MCATNTCTATTPIAIPASTSHRWIKFTSIRAMIAVIEAFQEALDMRRDAQRFHFMNASNHLVWLGFPETGTFAPAHSITMSGLATTTRSAAVQPALFPLPQ